MSALLFALRGDIPDLYSHSLSMVWMIRKPWGHALRLLLYLHKGVALPRLQEDRFNHIISSALLDGTF